MPSRRSGTRSHHGCQNCKARHVKCDETFPTCNRCLRRNEVCTLALRADMLPHGDSPLHPGSDGVTPTTGEPADTASATQTVQDFVGSPATIFANGDAGALDNVWLDDMLLDHYVRVVSWTLNENPKITTLYHDTVPPLATRHDHLRHALLSISGAHCVATLSAPQSSQSVSSQTVQALVERSLTHQSLALNTFVRAISAANSSTLTQEQSIALTLSSIFVLTSFIAHLHPAFQKFTYSDVSPISKAVALLNLQGPITVFFIQYREQIAKSELEVFTHVYPSPDVQSPVHSAEAADNLARISILCSDETLPQTDRDRYAEVVLGLAELSSIIAADPTTIGGRFRWVTAESASFMANKIYQRAPHALILMAHWAACQIPNPSAWWGSGFAEALILDVQKALSPSYHSYLEWPLRQRQQAQA